MLPKEPHFLFGCDGQRCWYFCDLLCVSVLLLYFFLKTIQMELNGDTVKFEAGLPRRPLRFRQQQVEIATFYWQP